MPELGKMANSRNFHVANISCFVYSMVDESSDVLELSRTRKKNLTFQFFFLRHARKEAELYYPVGRIPVINT